MLSENVNIICQVIYSTLITTISNERFLGVYLDVFHTLTQVRDPIIFSMISKYSDLCIKRLSPKMQEEVIQQTTDLLQVFVRQAQGSVIPLNTFYASFKRSNQHNTPTTSNAPRRFITIS